MRVLKVKNKKNKRWHEVDPLTSTGYYKTTTDQYFIVECNEEEFLYLVNLPKKVYNKED